MATVHGVHVYVCAVRIARVRIHMHGLRQVGDKESSAIEEAAAASECPSVCELQEAHLDPGSEARCASTGLGCLQRKYFFSEGIAVG